MKLSEIKINPNNPRIIKDNRFKKLVKSMQEFPKMMELRPIILTDENIVLGGNMRLKALKELGYKDIPDNWVKKASELTDEEKQRFIIADNVSFGEHDWEILNLEWDLKELEEWGLYINIEEKKDEEIKEKEIKGFKKTHVLLSFEPELMIKIQDKLQEIIQINGIEYEQSSN